jgi:hypothetical protein
MLFVSHESTSCSSLQKLVELPEIIEEKIGSHIEGVEIATNVTDLLCVADRLDEIEFISWTAISNQF